MYLGSTTFTEMWHNGVKVKFKNRSTEYGMMRDAHQVVLTFTLSLSEPQPLSGQTHIFSTFDLSYLWSICIMTRTVL